MAVFESGIDEFVRRANRAVEDMPEGFVKAKPLER